jgi:hypothetical protein
MGECSQRNDPIQIAPVKPLIDQQIHRRSDNTFATNTHDIQGGFTLAFYALRELKRTQQVARKTTLGEAIVYTLRQWKKPTTFFAMRNLQCKSAGSV